uniref:Uncharacterized protein n=1 Tax=Avena sativa TaxID=4498 RepID=A0ACD5VJF8_AVESA
MSPPSLCAANCSTPLRAAPPPLLRLRRPTATSVSASRAAAPSVSDNDVLLIAEQLEDSAPSSPILAPLRSASALSLLSTPWPTLRHEAFRFTDISCIRPKTISLPTRTPGLAPPPSSDAESQIIFSDGLLVSASGAHVRALADLPPGSARDRAAAAIAASAQFSHRDIFYDFNAVGASDVAVVYVPEGAKMADDPVHIMFGYSGSDDDASMMMSNPRVLVIAEKGSEVAIVEEHFGIEEGGGGRYWANPVVDIIVEEGARVVHSYVQRQSSAAAHTKWTTVQQNTSSTYEFVEVSTGGRLNRHNLHIQQLGPETVTDLSTFHLTSQKKQIHDLHSRLILDHPRGYSRQLHKLIACSDEGKGVFDGNIQVNRYAQQTDAGQQTKCLVLSPKAVVYVKPNLQIIADDVKCTHGAAISGDLDPNELFYFQARGVDVETATDALLFSFGAQVINRIPFKTIEKKALAQLKELLTLSRQSTD